MAQTQIQERQLEFDEHDANVVLVGPTTGADAVPTFRALVVDDLPDLVVEGASEPVTMFPGLIWIDTN